MIALDRKISENNASFKIERSKSVALFFIGKPIYFMKKI